LARSLLLGRLLRGSAPYAELLSGDVRSADESAVVRRPLDLEDGVVHLLAGASEGLLQLGLVVDVARARVLDPLAERVNDRRLDLLEAMFEIDSRDRRLEDGGEDVPAAGDPLELVLRRLARVLKETVAQPELLRDGGTALAGHDVCPDLGETPLRGRAETIEDSARDRELEDAVAEELEALVRCRAVVGPRGMREYLLEPVGRQLVDQAAELGRPGVGLYLSPDAR